MRLLGLNAIGSSACTGCALGSDDMFAAVIFALLTMTFTAALLWSAVRDRRPA